MLLLAAAREELGDLDGHVVGIGPVVAASSAARLLATQKPQGVVMVGTGGAYPGGPPINTAIAARQVGLSTGVAAMGLGYVPRPPEPVACDARLLSKLDVAKHNVLTVQAVTTDPILVERLADGWTVEHLEAFGVAYACYQAGVPFVAVLGISNLVGPDAHRQWLTNRDAAQQAARDAAMAALRDVG